MKKAIFIFLIFITTCGFIDFNQPIIGKWKGNNPKDGILVFKKNGEFNVIDENGKSVFEPTDSKVTIKYEILTELEPNQLYLNFFNENETHRVPFGIFKIEKGKLFLRESIEYHRTLGGIDIGVSRYEMPKDFSGIIKVFDKLNGQDQSITVFKGLPMVKISEGGVSRVPENITRGRAVNFKCIISKIGGAYYWASRENVKLSRIDSGAFSTFVAENGSGYIRIVNPDLKVTASQLGETEAKYDYTEHLLIGLGSVTYYGIHE